MKNFSFFFVTCLQPFPPTFLRGIGKRKIGLLLNGILSVWARMGGEFCCTIFFRNKQNGQNGHLFGVFSESVERHITGGQGFVSHIASLGIFLCIRVWLGVSLKLFSSFLIIQSTQLQ